MVTTDNFLLQHPPHHQHSTSSTTTNKTTFLQINLRKSEIPTSTLLEASNSHNPSIILVQEQYILDGRIAGIPRSWNQRLSKNNKAGNISLPSCNKPVFLQSTVNSTALKIQTEQGPLTVISAYFSPYKNIMETLQELHSILTDLGDERVLICADLNAHSRIWGYANEDTRGAQVEDFLLAQQLYLLNETNSPPTFEHRDRKGWPDLSFIKGTDFANSCTWKVLEDYTHSDHKYILIEALLSQSHYSYPRFKTAYGGHRRMLQHLGQKTKQLVQQIEESNTKDHLAKATEELQKAIFAACRKAYKIKKFKLKINNWWNQSLQIKKKELQALKREELTSLKTTIN
ncbi:hypothetical protein AVEN_244745-1 [Araneus ventricosus]|uniref:Endonuclease/exonuclease/phosphatase domain-containing protein n=1 Tax=Araneus ventricosus TaxID=182803 RepID=A0A4Y2BRD8_ARAVE|nr:hypothetical protein AVEN_244745-1 [Araneus ventricosus]